LKIKICEAALGQLHMQTPAFGPLKSQLQSIPRRTVFVSNRPLRGSN
jgi:hypothetical protein